MNQANEWSAEFFKDKQGRSPVEKFLNDLPPKERAKVDRLINLLERYGHKLEMYSKKQTKSFKGHKPLKELRPVPNRVIYFFYKDNRIILLHGFKKKTNHTPVKELELARSRMNQFLEGK